MHRLATDNALSPVDYFDATDQILVRFSYATATLNGGTPKSLDLLGSTVAYADASAAANSAANPAQVSTQNSLSSNWSTARLARPPSARPHAGSDFTGLERERRPVGTPTRGIAQGRVVRVCALIPARRPEPA